jgi:hypothetical protein
MLQLRRYVPALKTEQDIISGSQKGRLQWLGNVERMPDERTVKKVHGEITNKMQQCIKIYYFMFI